jgi:glycine cleavage system transcriptional repressor
MKEYVVTVMARDRVGIIRDVSSALTALGGNITHLSQTVLRGYFTLIISAEMADGRSCDEIRLGVERNGAEGEFRVGVHEFIPGGVEPGAPGTEQFTLSMQGKDQPGIIARTTSYLAEQGINVDDFYAYVHDGILLMLAQVSIPTGVDVEQVQAGLEQVGGQFGLIVHLQHEDIFRATSDVRPMGQPRC